MHWKQDPFYVFAEMILRGLVPDFYVQVSVSDLFIPAIGPPILLPVSVSDLYIHSIKK